MYCCYWGNQNSLLYQGLHYIKVHYIEVPLYNETSLCEQILPVPWLFVISRIHCICLKGHQNNYFRRRTRAKGVHPGSKIEVLWGELHSTETKWIVSMQSKKTVGGAGRKRKV